MDAPYRLEHDGMTCWLAPRSPLSDALLVVAGTCVVGVPYLSWVALSQAVPALLGVALAAAAVTAASLWAALRLRARRKLTCKGRRVTVEVLGPGGWGTRPVTRSLLDLYKAAATPEGWLVLEMDAGPLAPVYIDARGVDPTHLRAIADAVTEAAERAEAQRGDYPVAGTREVERLLER